MSNRIIELWRNLYFLDPDKLQTILVPALLSVLFIVFLGLRLFYRPIKTHGSRYPLIGSIKFWLFIIAFYAFVISAWAWPVISKNNAIAQRGKAEIIFAVDISYSMFLQGIGMPRVDVAAREIKNLLSSEILKNGDRAALYIYGSQAIGRVQLTDDLKGRFASELLRIGRPKNLYDGMYADSNIVAMLTKLYKSLDRQDSLAEFGVLESPKFKPRVRSDRLIIIFTDGDFFEYLSHVTEEQKQEDRANYEKALIELRARGLKVYSVGIGKRSGEVLMDFLKDYNRGKDYHESLEEEFKGIISELNVLNLEDISRSTGGEIFIIENSNVSAARFLKRIIDSHRSLVIKTISSDEQQDVWQYFLYAALIIFVIAVLFS